MLEIQHVDLTAPPERAWAAARAMSLGDSAFVRALIAVRTLPDRAKGAHPKLAPTIDDFVSTPEEPGFQRLHEADHEVVVGAMGKVCRASIPFVHVAPEAFAVYAEPDQVKVAWALSVEPLAAGCSRVVVEVRVDATDERASRKFRRYFRLIGPGSRAIRWQLLDELARVHGAVPREGQGWKDVGEGVFGAAVMALAFLMPFARRARSRWGVSESLAARVYPGDERIPEPAWMWTHGVEIDAPASRVWPWIAQLGAKEGGFYSYQWLENLVGCEIHNAERVHPEWQHQTGDRFYIHPKAPPLELTVSLGRWMLAHGQPASREGSWSEATWLFYLEELSAERCRFISRHRIAMSDDAMMHLVFGPALLEPIGFAMDRRMLLGVKQRAERA